MESEQDELTRVIVRFGEKCDALRAATRRLDDRCLDGCHEVLVTHLVRMDLQRTLQVADHADDLYDVPRMYRKVEGLPGHFPKGFEWDGVLYDPVRRHLYLVTAEGDLEPWHVARLGRRIRRTAEFIRLCAGTLQAAAYEQLGSSEAFRYATTCDFWDYSFRDAAHVHGVIGGVGFTPAMLDEAGRDGLTCVVSCKGGYVIKHPEEGLADSHITEEELREDILNYEGFSMSYD
jgi:hypothetical protein